MNTKKNKDELRAQKYLLTLPYSQVEYEPLGNVTPDFLLDKKIAVEVRRINRNHIDGNNIINVENIEIPLIKKIKKLIATFTHNSCNHSAYVSLTLLKHVSIDSNNSVLNKVKKTLKKHMRHILESKTYIINEFLEITFAPTEKKSNIYLYTSCNGDSEWVIHQLHKSIQGVINEKNKKIEKNFKLYPQWWLILVDSIVYSLDDKDLIELKKVNFKKHRFSKVIILSPKGDFQIFAF